MAAQTVRRYGLYLAGLIALVATSGSLYFGYVKHFIPCDLSWFQRAMMYSLTLLLLVGALRRDRGVAPYAILLAAVGATFSVAEYLYQKAPGILPTPSAKLALCQAEWINEFGFVTLPLLALMAFVLIAVLLWTATRPRREPQPRARAHETPLHGAAS